MQIKLGMGIHWTDDLDYPALGQLFAGRGRSGL